MTNAKFIRRTTLAALVVMAALPSMRVAAAAEASTAATAS